MMLQLNPKSEKLNRLSTYYGARLITKEWMQPTNSPHEIFSVAVDQGNPTASPLVTAYAVQRPDKQWSILAINKDPKHPAQLSVRFKFSDTQPPVRFSGKIDIIQFSRQQYVWRDDGPNGRPTRSFPPAYFRRDASSSYRLPPYSLTVLRGAPLQAKMRRSF
jgi:hypothetical protein